MPARWSYSTRRLAPIILIAALAAALVVADVSGYALPGPRLRPLADSLNAAATALFFGAGIFRYARWKVTDESYAAASSAALLVFAVATFPLVLAARDTGSLTTSSPSSSLARLLAALAVAAVLVPALRGAGRRGGGSPLRLVAVGLVALLGSFVALSTTSGTISPVLASAARASAGLDAVAALPWMAVAGLSLRAGLRERSDSALWSSVAMTLIACAAALRAAATEVGGWSWLVAVGALMLLASVVSVTNAGADALSALRDDRRRLARARDALAEAQQRLVATEARRAEVVHDARSVISAVQAAATTLDRHGDHLDAPTRHRLQEGMAVELQRLGRLIDGPTSDGPRAFSVAEVVEPLVALMRGDGLAVESRLDGEWAVGRPDDVAEALRNLLVNARVHAGGSPVCVRAERCGQSVRILVEDRGPGVDAALRLHLFDRGVGAGAGSGLGLHIARRLLLEQGGDLDVRDREGGGARFIASLPAAPSPSQAGVCIDITDAGPRRGRADVGRAADGAMAGTSPGRPGQRDVE